MAPYKRNKGKKMSIEEYLLDTGKSLEITEFETNCYGMSQADIRSRYMGSITARFSGLEMVVMGILSDCQELQAMGHNEAFRKQLNIAKFILSEMMDARGHSV